MTVPAPVRRFAGVLALALLWPTSAAAQQAEPPRLTLETIHASQTFAGERFQSGRWADEGRVVRYIRPEDGATHLVSYNLETDAQTRLIDGTTLFAEDVGRLIQIEDYAYSEDGTKLLLYTDSERVWRSNTKGFYYVYDLPTRRLTPVSDRARGFQMFAKLNPQGTRVAFVRDRNLFLVDLGTMEETPLTTDGADGTIINGTTDWVYEEEFRLRDGWQWSPDGRHIAFLKLDESNTRDFAMADLRGQYPDLVRFRYPKAGEDNSEIQVGVIDVATQAVTFFDTDTWNEGGERYEYIPRFGWTPALDGGHRVWMFRMDRDQNDLDFLYADPASGAVAPILDEHEDTWIDLRMDKLTFLDDGEHFVWRSERDGYSHLYLYTNTGQLISQITDGAWDVTDFHGLDEEAGVAYVTATIESPLERHLYAVSFSPAATGSDGGDETATPVRITRQPGTHSVDVSRDLRYYIDQYSNVTTPGVVTLHRIDGTPVKTLEENEALIRTVASLDLPAPEFVQVPGADGTPLNAWILKPRTFDPNRAYPLLMYVYGGPSSQTVQNAWGGSRYLWHAYLADSLDVLVASVDNRGTGARGKAFERGTYKRLGQLEAQDQVAAAQHFAGMPYVDADRIGIWGWSYGGYMTLMAMLAGDGPQTFKAGVSVAPVADWRQYDTIYTERYMSTPQANEAGYDAGAPKNYADRLRDDQDLLLIHGDFDDNVHFQNAVQMADALQAANKQFAIMMYPGRNHSIFGGLTRLHLHQLMTDFIKEKL